LLAAEATLSRVKINVVWVHHNDRPVHFNVVPVQINDGKIHLNILLNHSNIVPTSLHAVVGRLHDAGPDKIAPLSPQPRLPE
jgi:hypothetical protein